MIITTTEDATKWWPSSSGIPTSHQLSLLTLKNCYNHDIWILSPKLQRIFSPCCCSFSVPSSSSHFQLSHAQKVSLSFPEPCIAIRVLKTGFYIYFCVRNNFHYVAFSAWDVQITHWMWPNTRNSAAGKQTNCQRLLWVELSSSKLSVCVTMQSLGQVWLTLTTYFTSCSLTQWVHHRIVQAEICSKKIKKIAPDYLRSSQKEDFHEPFSPAVHPFAHSKNDDHQNMPQDPW